MAGEPILIDTNILNDISRGHTKAAEALRRHLDNGRTVYIGKAAYDELIDQAPDARYKAHYEAMVKDLGIKVADQPVAADKAERQARMKVRVNAYADNILHEPGGNRPGQIDEYNRKGKPGDMFIVAQAKSLNAALWTHDQKTIKRAREQGFKLAAECSLGGYSGKEDPDRGRRLLGLKPIHVTGSGKVIRNPSGGSGSSGSGGGSPPPPRGGPPPPAPSGGGTGAKGLKRSGGTTATKSIMGLPTDVPHPIAPSSRGKGIGGAIELLLRAINAAFGWALERKNAAKVAEALKVHGASVATRELTDGALLVMYYHEFDPIGPQNDSLIQPGPVFSHMEVYFAPTRDEAEHRWRSTPSLRPDRSNYKPKASLLWLKPVADPDMTRLATPFPKSCVARFIAGRQILQDIEWGGVFGFDDMGQSEVSGEDLTFFVLEPPPVITFYNGPYAHEVDIPLVKRKSGDGTTELTAVDLDPLLGVFVTAVNAVPVFPATVGTRRAFSRTRKTWDNTGHLRFYQNLKYTRWARPGNIEVIGPA